MSNFKFLKNRVFRTFLSFGLDKDQDLKVKKIIIIINLIFKQVTIIILKEFLKSVRYFRSSCDFRIFERFRLISPFSISDFPKIIPRKHLSFKNSHTIKFNFLKQFLKSSYDGIVTIKMIPKYKNPTHFA